MSRTFWPKFDPDGARNAKTAIIINQSGVNEDLRAASTGFFNFLRMWRPCFIHHNFDLEGSINLCQSSFINEPPQRSLALREH